MGSFTSKSFTDLLEEVETPPATPVGNRVADFDPRSPSSGITRTPIHLQQTPDVVTDPRSPTAGIVRTPILDGKTISKTSPVTVHEPVKLLLGDYSLHSPVTNSAISSLNTEVMIPDNQQNEVKGDTKVVQETSSTVGPSVVKVKKQQRTKQLQASSSPHKKQQRSGNRSPLTPVRVDTNSPRVIVQRKQVAKLGLMSRNSNSNTPPVQYERSVKGSDSPVRYDSLDKENVILLH